MASIFSRIVAGEIPCHKVAEDEEFFAFLDINPVAAGHTLVIPKKEIDYIFDIEDPMLGRMMAFAKRVARAQEAVIPCKAGRFGRDGTGSSSCAYSFNSDSEGVGYVFWWKENGGYSGRARRHCCTDKKCL